jgi:myosin heavy subunit
MERGELVVLHKECVVADEKANVQETRPLYHEGSEMSEQWLPSASDQEDLQGPTVSELLEEYTALLVKLEAVTKDSESRRKVMEEQATRLNDYVQQIAEMTQECESWERREKAGHQANRLYLEKCEQLAALRTKLEAAENLVSVKQQLLELEELKGKRLEQQLATSEARCERLKKEKQYVASRIDAQETAIHRAAQAEAQVKELEAQLEQEKRLYLAAVSGRVDFREAYRKTKDERDTLRARVMATEKTKATLYEDRNRLQAMLERIAAIPAVADGFHAPNEECVADGVESALDDLRQQLAAVTQELDEALVKCEQVIAWRRKDEEMIKGLYEQLAAVPPHPWTCEPPTKPEWCWYRETFTSPYRPVEVVIANYTGPSELWVKDDGEMRPLRCLGHEGGYWSGPLACPPEDTP